MTGFYLAIDDTDNLESKGTGWLARRLANEVCRTFNAVFGGVTRHQLYLHPDIPYTTHNSSACMYLVVDEGTPADIFDFAAGLVAGLSAPGSDPGISLAGAEVAEPVQEFGRRAQRTVITMDEAVKLAAGQNIFLKELGGTGQGIIGALAAIGLRAGGFDGRYLDLPGIRDLRGIVRVKDIIDNSGIDRVIDTEHHDVPATEPVNTMEWVRPTHYEHRPVLIVKKDDTAAYWIPAEKPQRGDF